MNPYSDLPDKYWELIELVLICKTWIYSNLIDYDMVTEFYIRIVKIEIMMYEFLMLKS